MVVREIEHKFVVKDDIITDPNFDRKLDLITAGAKPFVKEHLLTRISKENCLVIIAYVLTMQTEINPSERYRIDTIHPLKHLAEFHKPKSFREMNRQDIIDYLDRLRKPEQEPLGNLGQCQKTFQEPPLGLPKETAHDNCHAKS